MEQLARDDIAAAAAAHHELGRDYDGAVAESLVERIGAEIDKRVDARLGHRAEGGQPIPSARPPWSVVALGIGSMGIGAILAPTLVHAGASWLVLVIWIIIGAVNVAYARRR